MSSTCDTTTICPCDHDNCGCTNPNTFGCTSFSGTALPNLPIANGEDGNTILQKIDTAVGKIGKVLVDSTDVCSGYMEDKLIAGLNISLTPTGIGCAKGLRIDASVGGIPVDVKAKVSATDTTSDYLNNKIVGGTYIAKSILSPAGNEKLKLDLVPATLVSSDAGNQLAIGTDGALLTLYTAPDGTETHIVQGTGVIVSGTGSTSDPYVISTNASIQVARPCFDNVWRSVTLVATGNGNVVYVSGAPQYRYRFDGSIEFKGSATYTVSFGAYSTSNRRYMITIGNIPSTCLTLPEQAGTSDLKSMHYIDTPQASADQITQQYGYVIRKSTQNIIIEFQSSFTGSTNKTIVVNFDGAISHPSL